jgi:hypothetical protein
MRSHLLAGGAALLAAAISSLAPGGAAAQSPSALTLSPTKAVGMADKGRVLGPFSLHNGTLADYDVKVSAVMLGQRRSGEIVVLDDAQSRRRAGRAVGLQLDRFTLKAGRARSVAGIVRRSSPRRGVYAGLLFSSRPRHTTSDPGRAQITNVLRLNASQYLDPRHAHAAFSAGLIRAEQVAPRRLRLQIPVANRGNVLARMTGRVDVRDANGKRVLRAPVGRTGILPGATVDVPAPLAGRLAAGRYTLSATLHGRGRLLRASGTMVLYGVNTVRSEDARLTAFASPTATKGDPVEIKARFRNTGNVLYRPGARLEVRAIDVNGEAVGNPIRSQLLAVEAAAPGHQGEITGSIHMPEGRAFQLTLHLLAGGRELDVQALRVDVREAPPLGSRLQELLRTNAIIILAGLLGLMLAAAAVTFRYVARLKAGSSARYGDEGR